METEESIEFWDPGSLVVHDGAYGRMHDLLKFLRDSGLIGKFAENMVDRILSSEEFYEIYPEYESVCCVQPLIHSAAGLYATTGFAYAMENLLKFDEAMIHQLDSEGKTALHIFCENVEHLDFRQTENMIKLGFDPFILDESEMLPIQYLYQHHFKYMLPCMMEVFEHREEQIQRLKELVTWCSNKNKYFDNLVILIMLAAVNRFEESGNQQEIYKMNLLEFVKHCVEYGNFTLSKRIQHRTENPSRYNCKTNNTWNWIITSLINEKNWTAVEILLSRGQILDRNNCQNGIVTGVKTDAFCICDLKDYMTDEQTNAIKRLSLFEAFLKGGCKKQCGKCNGVQLSESFYQIINILQNQKSNRNKRIQKPILHTILEVTFKINGVNLLLLAKWISENYTDVMPKFDLEVENSLGETLLIAALNRKRSDTAYHVVRLLLEWGANTEAKNAYGENCNDIVNCKTKADGRIKDLLTNSVRKTSTNDAIKFHEEIRNVSEMYLSKSSDTQEQINHDLYQSKTDSKGIKVQTVDKIISFYEWDKSSQLDNTNEDQTIHQFTDIVDILKYKKKKKKRDQRINPLTNCVRETFTDDTITFEEENRNVSEMYLSKSSDTQEPINDDLYQSKTDSKGIKIQTVDKIISFNERDKSSQLDNTNEDQTIHQFTDIVDILKCKKKKKKMKKRDQRINPLTNCVRETFTDDTITFEEYSLNFYDCKCIICQSSNNNEASGNNVSYGITYDIQNVIVEKNHGGNNVVNSCEGENSLGDHPKTKDVEYNPSVETSGNQDVPLFHPDQDSAKSYDLSTCSNSATDSLQTHGVEIEKLEYELECTKTFLSSLYFYDYSMSVREKLKSFMYDLAENGKPKRFEADTVVVTVEYQRKIDNLFKEFTLHCVELLDDTFVVFEYAMNFSVRCYNFEQMSSECNVNSPPSVDRCAKVLRIWDIDDNVKTVIERVKRAYVNGVNNCTYFSKRKDISQSCYKCCYENDQCLDNTLNTEQYNESSVLKLYAITSQLVECIVMKNNPATKFPLKLTEKECDAIHCKPNPEETVLLLGKSGTDEWDKGMDMLFDHQLFETLLGHVKEDPWQRVLWILKCAISTESEIAETTLPVKYLDEALNLCSGMEMLKLDVILSYYKLYPNSRNLNLSLDDMLDELLDEYAQKHDICGAINCLEFLNVHDTKRHCHYLAITERFTNLLINIETENKTDLVTKYKQYCNAKRFISPVPFDSQPHGNFKELSDSTDDDSRFSQITEIFYECAEIFLIKLGKALIRRLNEDVHDDEFSQKIGECCCTLSKVSQQFEVIYAERNNSKMLKNTFFNVFNRLYRLLFPESGRYHRFLNPQCGANLLCHIIRKSNCFRSDISKKWLGEKWPNNKDGCTNIDELICVLMILHLAYGMFNIESAPVTTVTPATVVENDLGIVKSKYNSKVVQWYLNYMTHVHSLHPDIFGAIYEMNRFSNFITNPRRHQLWPSRANVLMIYEQAFFLNVIFVLLLGKPNQVAYVPGRIYEEMNWFHCMRLRTLSDYFRSCSRQKHDNQSRFDHACRHIQEMVERYLSTQMDIIFDCCDGAILERSFILFLFIFSNNLFFPDVELEVVTMDALTYIRNNKLKPFVSKLINIECDVVDVLNGFLALDNDNLLELSVSENQLVTDCYVANQQEQKYL